MSSDVVLEATVARASGGTHRDERDVIIGYARTVPLPWLMLFGRADVVPQQGTVPLVETPRVSAIARFRERSARITPALEFVPDARALFDGFASYLERVEPDWLSLNAWEYWITGLDHGADFDVSLQELEHRMVSAMDVFDQTPEPASGAWLALLDWTHPSRHDADSWLTNCKAGLFGWPSVQGPPRPWVD
jgi:hypothetical protein